MYSSAFSLRGGVLDAAYAASRIKGHLRLSPGTKDGVAAGIGEPIRYLRIDGQVPLAFLGKQRQLIVADKGFSELRRRPSSLGSRSGLRESGLFWKGMKFVDGIDI
jgi:hypothetical protein